MKNDRRGEAFASGGHSIQKLRESVRPAPVVHSKNASPLVQGRAFAARMRQLAGYSPAFRHSSTSARNALPLLALLLGLVCVLFGGPAFGQSTDTLPAELKDVAINQRLNEQLPLDTVFKDEDGHDVRLGQYFQARPVLLNFVYYECPMLCTEVLNGLVSSLRVLQFTPGKEFEIVTISFDTRDTPALARAKKENYLKDYRRQGAGKGWHFLTGTEASIQKVTQAAGFEYKWIPQDKQFAHAAGIMILTPKGRLARYFYGIEYSSRDIRLALVEASENKIGSPTDQVLLYCFHYDPKTARYSASILNFVRAGGVLTVIGLGILFVKLNSTSKKRKEDRGANVS